MAISATLFDLYTHSEHLPFGLSTEVGKAGSEDRHKNLDF